MAEAASEGIPAVSQGDPYPCPWPGRQGRSAPSGKVRMTSESGKAEHEDLESTEQRLRHEARALQRASPVLPH